MKINKFAFLIGLAVAAVLFWQVAAYADATNQSTKLTFNEPVEIPGQVLPAGTYLFKLADSDDLNVVRIFNSEGTRLYATLQTIPVERQNPTTNPVLVMAEEPAGNPDAVLKWFYPGTTSGHQFVYRKHEEQELAGYRHETITVGQNETAVAGD